MTASLLDTAKYNTVAANTVFDAVLDAAAILAWRQNVKLVVDQHATEIDGKLDKTGGTVTGSNGVLTLKKSASGVAIFIPFLDQAGVSLGYIGFGTGGDDDIDIRNSVSGAHVDVLTTGAGRFRINSIPIITGTGTPEGIVTAVVGSLFLRTDAATSLYVKQTTTGNTGWVAK